VHPISKARPDYADLVRRSAGGDRAALEQLLVSAQEVAYRFSRTVCGGPDDAEDVMQEALLKTFRYVRSIRAPEAFRTWLFRTVRNACLMKRRRGAGEPARLVSLDEVLPAPHGVPRARDVADPALGPDDLAMNAALRRRLGSALQRLPPAYRAIVFLREMEGLSTRETSQVLGLSEDNVKARLHRARLFLQRELAAASRPEPRDDHDAA
jgi:RNA polymerase sigma-70 factor (ECF subfamily)